MNNITNIIWTLVVQYLSELNWEIVKLLGEISHTRCLDVDSEHEISL